MQPGLNKATTSFNNKLLTCLLAGVIYRVITISISLIYIQFFVPHKIQISTNIYGFYLYVLLVFFIFLSGLISRQVIGIAIAVASTLLLGINIFKADLPYRALSFVFSASWAYLFVFTSNLQSRKIQSESLTSKAVRRLKYILLTVYPIYLMFEKEMFRNVSLFIFCMIFLAFFISWLNRKLQ